MSIDIDPTPRSRPVEATAALALIVAIFALLHTWNFSEKCFGQDFYQFWVVGREIHLNHSPDIYTESWRKETADQYRARAQDPKASTHEQVASDQRKRLDTTATPALYICFSPLGSLDYASALLIYQIIVFSSSILAIAIWCRMLRFSAGTTLLMIAILLGWGEAFLSEIFDANTNAIQLLLAGVLVWAQLRRPGIVRDLFCGALSAVIVIFKPNLITLPAILWLTWILDGDWPRLLRQTFMFLIVAIGLIVLTSLRLENSHCWLQWLGSAHELVLERETSLGSNCSLMVVMKHQFGGAAGWIAGLTVLAITIVTMILCRKQKDVSDADSTNQPMRILLISAIGCALPLLVSPMAWLHYFVLGMPLLAIALRPSHPQIRGGLPVWARYMIATPAAALLCNSLLTTEVFWLNDPQSVAERLVGATAGLFILALIEYLRVSLPSAGALSSSAETKNYVASQIR